MNKTLLLLVLICEYSENVQTNRNLLETIPFKIPKAYLNKLVLWFYNILFTAIGISYTIHKSYVFYLKKDRITHIIPKRMYSCCLY